MQAIKRKDTSCEILLRKELYRLGLRYRVDYGKIPGRPDIAFVGKRIAVFCDSEFWHGRNWEEKKLKIKANRDYWIPKIERNIARDVKTNVLLEELGWTVLRFWDVDIKKDLQKVINIIVGKINDENGKRLSF